MRTWSNIELLKEQVDDLDLSEATKLSLWNTIYNIEEDFKYNDIEMVKKELEIKDNEIWKLKHEINEALDLNDKKYIRIYKAIEYIETHSNKGMFELRVEELDELIKILKGE